MPHPICISGSRTRRRLGIGDLSSRSEDSTAGTYVALSSCLPFILSSFLLHKSTIGRAAHEELGCLLHIRGDVFDF